MAERAVMPNTNGLLFDFDDVPPNCFLTFVTLGRKVRPGFRFIKCQHVVHAVPREACEAYIGESVTRSLCLRAGGQLRCRRYDAGGGPIRPRVNGWGARHVRLCALAAALEPRQCHHFPSGLFQRTLLYGTTSPVALSRQPPAFSSMPPAGISLHHLRPEPPAARKGVPVAATHVL